MARRITKKRSPYVLYLIIFVVLCVAGYIVYLIVDSFLPKTTVIEAGNVGNQYMADAVVVRSEDLTDAEGLTSVKYFANEGELAYKGDKIAEVYAAGYSQTDINRLLNIRAEIKSSVRTILEGEYADAQLERHDEQVMDYAREVGMLVGGTAAGNLLNLERQLSTALSQRQSYIKTQYYNQYPQLAELYDSETSQIKKIQSWTNTYLADRDCIVSFYTDGYETMLGVEQIDQITADQVHSILAGAAPEQSTAQRGRTPVFRKVNPTGWYLLLLTREEEWFPATGQEYKIKLSGFEDYIIDAVVTTYQRFGAELLVRMSVAGDVRPVLNVRTASAEVGEKSVAGLRVPRNALRQQDGYVGVVLTDGGGIFVPISVVQDDSDYVIIQSMVPGALMEGQKIRLF